MHDGERYNGCRQINDRGSRRSVFIGYGRGVECVCADSTLYRTYEITLTVPSGHMDDIDPIDLECFLASDPDVEEADVNLMVNVEEDNPFPDESSFVFQQMNMDHDDEDDDDLHEIPIDPYAISVDSDEDEEDDDVDAEFDEMAEDESDLYAAMSIREDDIPEEDRNEFADLEDYDD